MSIQIPIHMLKAAVYMVEKTKMFFNQQREKLQYIPVTVYYSPVKRNRLLMLNLKITFMLHERSLIHNSTNCFRLYKIMEKTTTDL